MKNMYVLLVVATSMFSVQAFANREIKCQAVKIEKDMNFIKTVNLSLAGSGAGTANVARQQDNTINTQERSAVAGQTANDQQSFSWYESNEVPASTDLYVVSSIDLVKKDTSKLFGASWFLRKTLVKKTGGAYCLPNEDKDCKLSSEVVMELPVVCSDTVDVTVADSTSTQQAIDSNPCNPNYWNHR